MTRIAITGASAALLLTGLLAAPARAGLDVAVDNGTRIDGDIAPADDDDTFRVTLPEGAKLKVTLKGLKGDAPPPPFRISVLDDTDAQVVAGVAKGKSVRVKNHVVGRSGEHRVIVTTDGSAPGSYRMTIKWAAAKRVRRDVTFSGASASTVLPAQGAATAKLTVKATKGSTALPRFETLDGPGGYSFTAFDPATDGKPKHTHKRVLLGDTGEYELGLSDAGTGGGAAITLKLKLAKIVKAKLELTSKALGGSSPNAPDDVIGKLVTPAETANIQVIGEDAGVLAGAGIVVPAGAVTSPAMIVIGESPIPMPAPDPDLQAVGPTVFFGPPGLTFSIDAVVSVPFDTTGLGGDFSTIRVYRRDEDGTVALVDPLDYDFDAEAGSVSFPVSHFTSFRAFSVAGAAFATNEKTLAADLVTQFMHFGDSISLSGDTLVVGSPYSDRFRSDGGAVFVFEREGGQWNVPYALVVADLAADDLLGWQVAVDGDWLIASAPSHDNPSNPAGKVYVFQRISGTFQHVDDFVVDGVGTNGFGRALDIDGDRFVVGFGNESVGGNSLAGAVYVYDYDGQSWSLTQRIEDATERQAFAARFGHDVDVDGDRLLISHHGSSRAYVYELDQGLWSEAAILEVTADTGVDQVSDRVALEGDIAILADAFDDRDGSASANYGTVWAFHFDGAAWGLEKKITLVDGERGDKFGTSLAIQADTVVVGSLGRGLGNPGSVTLFQRRGGSWPLLLEYAPAVLGTQAQLGTSVAISGDTIAGGAPFADVVNTQEGAVFVFDLVLNE